MSSQDPTQSPHYLVTVEGLAALTQENSRGMSGVTIEEHVDMISMAIVSFEMEGSDLDWTSNFAMGKTLQVSIGEGSEAEVMFSGFVTEVRFERAGGKRTATVTALDPLCKLAASRNTKVFESEEGQADTEIVKTVLGSLAAEIADTTATTGKSKYVFQRNESDLVFLKRLAARNGCMLMANKDGKVDLKKLEYTAPDSDGTLDVENLGGSSTLDYTISTMGLPKEVTVSGWDYEKKERVEQVVSSIGDYKLGTGSAANEVSDLTFWDGKSYFISDVFVSEGTAATGMAQAELNRLSRSYIRGRAVCDSKPALRAGKFIKFTGLGDNLNPEGLIIAARHVINAKSSTTEIHFVGNTERVSNSS